MKKKIVLISCVSKKETEACKAKDMYVSPLFKMSWEYAKQFSPDKVFILSAEHHLLDPEQRIDPYNVTLYTFAAAERKAWAQRVLSDLEAAGLDLEHEEILRVPPWRGWYSQFHSTAAWTRRDRLYLEIP